MGKKREPSDFKDYQNRPHFSAGLVIFGLVFLYLIITVILSAMDRHIAAYEVREGSILKDNSYTAFAIRNEEVIQAEASGYINFFVLDTDKIGSKTRVYTISPGPLNFREESGSRNELNAEQKENLVTKFHEFDRSFDEKDFSSAYTLKNNVTKVLSSHSEKSREGQLTAMLQRSSADLDIYYAAADGMIKYTLDGFEGVDLSSVTHEMLTGTDIEQKEVTDNTEVSRGDPIYKVIKDNTWSLVMEFDDAMMRSLVNTSVVKVKFIKDGETERADLKIIETKDHRYLGVMTFYSGMIRYADDRYVDFELIMQDETGLKIPKSSVVDKSFYTIPSGYLTTGGAGKEEGVMVQKAGGEAVFQKTAVYYQDAETEELYLDPTAFDEHTVLIKPKSTETLELTSRKNLKGVYNINKGYAVFKQIHILCESDEYYIVQSGSDYGLANYDHIALNGNELKENDVIY